MFWFHSEVGSQEHLPYTTNAVKSFIGKLPTNLNTPTARSARRGRPHPAKPTTCPPGCAQTADRCHVGLRGQGARVTLLGASLSTVLRDRDAELEVYQADLQKLPIGGEVRGGQRAPADDPAPTAWCAGDRHPGGSVYGQYLRKHESER